MIILYKGYKFVIYKFTGVVIVLRAGAIISRYECLTAASVSIVGWQP